MESAASHEGTPASDHAACDHLAVHCAKAGKSSPVRGHTLAIRGVIRRCPDLTDSDPTCCRAAMPSVVRPLNLEADRKLATGATHIARPPAHEGEAGHEPNRRTRIAVRERPATVHRPRMDSATRAGLQARGMIKMVFAERISSDVQCLEPEH